MVLEFPQVSCQILKGFWLLRLTPGALGWHGWLSWSPGVHYRGGQSKVGLCVGLGEGFLTSLPVVPLHKWACCELWKCALYSLNNSVTKKWTSKPLNWGKLLPSIVPAVTDKRMFWGCLFRWGKEGSGFHSVEHQEIYFKNSKK